MRAIRSLVVSVFFFYYSASVFRMRERERERERGGDECQGGSNLRRQSSTTQHSICIFGCKGASTSKAGVFNLLSSRANLHVSYNPAGRSHCRLQNHHGYIKHHHRAAQQMTKVKCLWRRWNNRRAPPHSPTLTSLHLRHSSFSNSSDALPTSQLILQPFCCFTYGIGISPSSRLILQPFRRFFYATAHSITLLPLHLRHRSLYNPSFASPTSQALHVLHLASRLCIEGWKNSPWLTSLLQKVRSSYSFG